MSAESISTAEDTSTPLRVGIVGVATLAVVVLVGLSWAKWLPYLDKAWALAGTRTWPGVPLFDAARSPSGAPTLLGAWHFTVDYFAAIWRALVVALLVGAAVDSLVPKRWLLAAVDRRTRVRQALVGGVLAAPGMMCTCCTAPVTVALRKRGAPLAASIAYWVGNPLLNPAVLVFLLLVLPWPYAVVRLLVGGVLVVAASVCVARWVETTSGRAVAPVRATRADPETAAMLPRRFLASLIRLTVFLVPEYALVVVAVGLLSGPLSDFDAFQRHLGLLGLVVVALVATALVIPTGGEIPVLVALAAAGGSAGLAGVLLIALPAVSIPSMVMVGASLGWRATSAVAMATALGGIAAGAMLAVLL